MMPSGSPREVFERLHGFVRDYDLRVADCYAVDGVYELPFAPTGMPRRVVGREAIRALLEPAYRAARQAGRKIMDYTDLRVIETADPEVIVAEFDYLGRITTTGHVFQLPNVTVMRVRDGRIVASRDYGHQLAGPYTLGHEPALARIARSV